MAPIDPQNGELGQGCIGIGVGELNSHPVTGVTFEGFRLTQFDEARALVLKAHNVEGFRDYSMIGWDVAFTPDGPILIEGNGKPGLNIIERGSRQLAGDGRLGELIAWHVKQALDQRKRPPE